MRRRKLYCSVIYTVIVTSEKQKDSSQLDWDTTYCAIDNRIISGRTGGKNGGGRPTLNYIVLVV